MKKIILKIFLKKKVNENLSEHNLTQDQTQLKFVLKC